MKFLKNKKGIDYALWLTAVVFICIVYAFIVINEKIDKYHWKIGEHEVALLNTYQKAEENLLYVDNAARNSVWQAVDSLADLGGMPNKECGTITAQETDYTLWNQKDKDCYKTINFYESYSKELNEKLNSYLSQKNLPQDNYEFTVLKDKVSGLAIEPLSIPIVPPPGKIVTYWLTFKVYEAEVSKAAVGKYYIRPSFTIPAKTSLDNYEHIRIEINKLVECAEKPTINPAFVKECSKDLSGDDLTWAITPEIAPPDNTYFFDITQKEVKNVYTGKSPIIRFAMNIPKPPEPVEKPKVEPAIKKPRVK